MKTLYCFLVLAVATCVLTGCGGPGIEPPPTPLVKSVVGGSEFSFDDEIISIDGDYVTGFEVFDVYPGPEGKSATATLSFDYTDRDGIYHVEGVVSYSRSESEAFEEPRFEQTSVRRLQ